MVIFLVRVSIWILTMSSSRLVLVLTTTPPGSLGRRLGQRPAGSTWHSAWPLTFPDALFVTQIGFQTNPGWTWSQTRCVVTWRFNWSWAEQVCRSCSAAALSMFSILFRFCVCLETTRRLRVVSHAKVHSTDLFPGFFIISDNFISSELTSSKNKTLSHNSGRDSEEFKAK